MKDDYLWDGSGEPDPEIQNLESILGRYRHDRPAPDFRKLDHATLTIAEPRRARIGFVAAFAGLAAAAAVALALVYSSIPRQRSGSRAASWNVASLAGTPQIGALRVSGAGASGALRAGETLITDNRSRARITDSATGQVDVDPDSRLRAIESRSGVKRLALDRGTIHAQIWAPAGSFVVDTPSAEAVDLGCIYTLHVDESGAGLIQTSYGWVGFKLDGHESFIPTGAACPTHPNTGPGTPYFEDASSKLREALATFDSVSATPAEKSTALNVVLAEARVRDALTLWHLLSRAAESDRMRVYDRLAAFVPPPAGVTREGIERLDRAMLDSWWNQLGLGDIKLWRNWERNWPGPSDAQK
jgi:hypothetical protein